MKKIVCILSISMFIVFLTACKKDIDNKDEDIKSSVPLIESVDGGDLSDGTLIEISGTGFGSNDLDIEWLGGKDGNIEQGISGNSFSKSNWIVADEGAHNAQTKYSNAQFHSGNNSLLCNFYDDDYDSFFTYDHGSSRVEWFMTAWLYFDKQDDAMRLQWKNFRISGESSLGSTKSALAHNWWYYHPDYTYMVNEGWGGLSQIYTTNSTNSVDRVSIDGPPKDAYLFEEWQRVEIYVNKSSSADISDGIYNWRRIGYDEEINKIDVVTHSEYDLEWRYYLMGIYYGNLSNADNSSFVGTRDMKLYYDDIYISDTRARVEIGNKETWDECTHREIQVPTTWAEGSIQIKLNKGSFQTGDTAYLFVITENGNVSDGFEIIIGGK